MPTDPQRARDLFLHAVGTLPLEQWDGFLAEACRGDAELERQVRRLLQNHREAGSFLETPAVAGGIEQLAEQEVGQLTQAEPVEGEEPVELDFLAPSQQPDSLGRLGQYEVQEVLGRGGMGIVLRAFDKQLHRVVAIKVMAQQLATNATARKRFKREAQAVAAVVHDHIVTLHAVQETNGLPYLVMHYVAGLSLQERLDRDGPLELHEILRIGMQTASGLAAAHAQGLVHRDIKPANILLENGIERVKITDFGLARAGTEGSLTQSGVVCGTPQYMSPEQAEGKALDPRTDLFSLGSVLYAMCTGRAPFRASGTMAVLKRVCEEAPSPIRATNPEIPDWLVALIDKLHAKDPAERFQTAEEVAELLGSHLARVQHPSLAPLPVVGVKPKSARDGGAKPAGAAPSARRRWVAAAALLCLVGGLSLTEAAGVTRLRATVIRLFTPEGTLVVETDDPAVKVTVEGDGDLVVTGAGPQEVRLRAGSYRLNATKNGKPVPLDHDLVNITRGGREIVRVRLEADPPPKIAAKGGSGAFVLQAAGKERRFDTLAEAVQTACDGDTIEIRGNGPFVTQPIRIAGRALTVRAGEGFRPVLLQQPARTDDGAALISTGSLLVLEGLELRGDAPRQFGMVWSQAPLHLVNCRFISNRQGKRTGAMVVAHNSPLVVLRNCEYLRGSNICAVRWNVPPNGRLVMENCCGIDGRVLRVSILNHDPKDVSIDLVRNTWCTKWPTFELAQEGPVTVPSEKARRGVIHWTTSGNVFDGEDFFLRFDQSAEAVQKIGPKPVSGKALLTQMVDWKEANNVLNVSGLLIWSVARETAGELKELAAWNDFWKLAGTGTLKGPVRFQGGNLWATTTSLPENIRPDDFRLRPDSAGYRAGKDGKDLGADIDLVGPGAAYERWKKMPEYQVWRKESGQVEK